MRLLIVEDVEEMRELLRETVDGLAEVHSSALASSCSEARLEIDRNRPDLVLLDEVLPGESSLDLLAELVERKISVLLITGIADATHEVPSGALGRVAKPDWNSIEAGRERIRPYLVSR